MSWTEQPTRVFQHLLRETDAVGLDHRTLIDEVRSVGASTYIAMGGGFSAWYPTALSCQTVNPHMSGDFLGDVTEEAAARDVKVLVRMDISKGRSVDRADQAEWFVRRPDGSVSTVWTLPQMCATGPFWQIENFAILDEIMRRYRSAGFFYNYLHVPRCHCDRCQRIVRAATGEAVPAPGLRSPVYERWRQSYLADYMGKVRQFIRARDPEAVLVPYHHVRDGWDVHRMAAISDIVGAQASNPVVPNPVDPQPMWNHWTAEEALTARAIKPGHAPLLIQTSSEFFASRQTAMPPGRILHNLVQAAAHGASTAPAVNGRLSGGDLRFLPALTSFGEYLGANAAWYEGLASVARVAIVKSGSSQLWGSDAGRPVGHPDGLGHVAEFRGIYEALTALRYPCDVLVADPLTDADLARYDVIVLPAVSCLSCDDARAIDRYVSAGGRVVATADLAACDENGRSRDTPALDGAPALPGPTRNAVGAYFELVDSALRTRLGGIPQIGASGDFWAPFGQDPSPGDDLRLIGPFANNAPEFTTVAGPGVEPGLIARTSGRGQVVWMPWRIGALYHRFAIPEYAELIGHLMENLAGPPPVSSPAAETVEFVLYGHPRGAVLHVLNGAAAQGKPIIATTPLDGFEIRVTTEAATARLLNTGETLAAARDGGELVFRLPRLDTFAAIALIDDDDADDGETRSVI